VHIVRTLRAAATGAVVALVYVALVAWLALQAQGAAVGARVGLDTMPFITGDPVVPWWYHLLTALLTVAVLAAATWRSRRARTWSYGPLPDGEQHTPSASRRGTADLWAATATLVAVVVVGVATIAPLEPTGMGAGAIRPALLVYVQLAAQSPALHVATLGTLCLTLAPVVARRRSRPLVHAARADGAR